MRPRVTLLACLAVTSAAVAVAAAAPAARTTRVAVYLVRGNKLAPVRRVVPTAPSPIRAALNALAAGPTAAERRAGYTSAIPKNVRVTGVTVSRGVAHVTLTANYAAGGGNASLLLRIAQVVYTATQFPGARRASVGGKSVAVQAVDRDTFEAQTPPILVNRPLPGEIVGPLVVVSGTANVFEARLQVDLHDARGKLIAHRSIMATSGTGTRGTFSVKIPTTVEGRAQFVVFANSPKDGSRIDVVKIPVTLR